MKKRVKRQKDNFYEEIDDEDAFVPDIAIYKFGYLNQDNLFLCKNCLVTHFQE